MNIIIKTSLGILSGFISLLGVLFFGLLMLLGYINNRLDKLK